MKSVIIDGIEYVPKEPSSKQDPFIKRLKDRWADGNVEAILNSPPSNKQEPKENVFTWDEVKEFVKYYNNLDGFIFGTDPIGDSLKEWKQSKKPSWEVYKSDDEGKITVPPHIAAVLNSLPQNASNTDSKERTYTQSEMDKAIADAFTNGRAGKCKEWPEYTYNTVKDYLKTIKP